MFQLEWKDKEIWRRLAKEVQATASPDDKHVRLSSLLFWEEHCVECAAPACFKSCGLYADRGDGYCRRFLYGIYPNRRFSGLFNYGADIHFKRWAKLEAKWPEKLVMFSVGKVRCLAAAIKVYDSIFCTLLNCLSAGTKLFQWNRSVLITGKMVALKLLARLASGVANPDALYIKLFSTELTPCNLQFELIEDVTIYRSNLKVVPGWNEYHIPFDQFNFKSGENRRIRFWIDRDQEVRLIFTWLDFVKFKSKAPATQDRPADKIKCVAWDLDNTLWKGVIGDDGKEGVEVVPEALNLIRLLDQRGILQTIASKNEHDTAWEKIVELGLDEFFLYPAINWAPKSANLLQIAKELNINVNSFALIDDSEFERAEVSAACPQVRVYDSKNIPVLLDYGEFDVPVTNDTGKRRLKYLEDINRKSARRTWIGDLDGFLKDCSIELNITTIQHQDQIDRCLELLHRSNQFNLSGKRYTPDEFRSLLRASEYDNYALAVHDRFGDYGIVGFVSVQKTSDAVIVTDFVMSCRVARKKIENAFFYWYLNRTECGGKKAYARMKVTGRNQPLRQVFNELLFEVVDETDSEIMMQADIARIVSSKPPISIRQV